MNKSDKHVDPDVKRAYYLLRLIRQVELRIAEVYPSDKIKSPVHLSIGQEAVSVGVCMALQEEDYVSGTYRGHATYLAHGGDLCGMIAELYGKAGGTNQGKGGSMHLADLSNRVLGSSAVVGTTIPIALGYALGLVRQRRPGVVACFFGDGATEEGAFYESLNFAALHRLPVLFVCENNGYAIHTPLAARWANPVLLERVAGFGVPTSRIETMDVFEILARARGLLGHVREGGGPLFLECKTYRWHEHVGPGQDYDGDYRTHAELEPWVESDAVSAVATCLPPDAVSRIDSEIEEQIDDAFSFAEASPFPPAEELTSDVYHRGGRA